MKLIPTIGLEIHIQLKTKSKMFCRCSSATFGEAPNSHVCPVCLGLPGALPVPNATAIKLALLAGEVLGSKHPKISKFDRKNYFYPDLPKGYQISQFDCPLNIGGTVLVEGKKVTITRAHLEEDTGKLLHQGDKSLIDFNRSGLPLLEIVSEPVLDSPEQARLYAQKIQQLMRYAGISDADMEKGSLRIDANVSVRRSGQTKLNSKVEIKNMNSFRSVERALHYEIERQTKLLAAGKSVNQSTRGWDDTSGVTVEQRAKEESHDYRYFPEPDLPALTITPSLIKEVAAMLPELPDAKVARFIKQYQLSDYSARVLASDIKLAHFFEAVVTDLAKFNQDVPVKTVANWMTGEFLAQFNIRGQDWDSLLITPGKMAELLHLFDQGKLSATPSKIILAEMFEVDRSPQKLIQEHGFVLQSDAGKLNDIARRVVIENPTAVSDFHHGKAQAFGFLLGKMMQQTKGQADPTAARQALTRALTKS